MCLARLMTSMAMASMTTGVWEMPLDERWQLYFKWSTAYHDALTCELMALLASHEDHAANLKVYFLTHEVDSRKG